MSANYAAERGETAGRRGAWRGEWKLSCATVTAFRQRGDGDQIPLIIGSLNRGQDPLKTPAGRRYKQGEDLRRIVDTAPALFERVSRAVAPQIWRGMMARRRPAVQDG